ncbi:hypothetical protein ACS33_09570 [Edwardsiella ictaluri]|nr:hypothetical protein ABY58_09605 [Edwardsiella ictaluri]KOO55129.1 hypothetical protein ACS33_09570 [Edwardsiella ictaluri]
MDDRLTYHFKYGLMRFKCRRAGHILALQVTFFDALRHIAAGANVGRRAAKSSIYLAKPLIVWSNVLLR